MKLPYVYHWKIHYIIMTNILNNFWIHQIIQMCNFIHCGLEYIKLSTCLMEEKNPLLCSFFLMNIELNNIVNFIKKLNELQELLVSLCLTSLQCFWQLQASYKWYDIKWNIIKNPSNINSTQLLLFHLPHDEMRTGLSLKRWMECKSPYLIGNVCLNLIMLVLHDFLNT